jgi:hypothetical protein
MRGHPFVRSVCATATEGRGRCLGRTTVASLMGERTCASSLSTPSNRI